MWNGFCFGFGMMMGLLAPAALSIFFIGLWVFIRDRLDRPDAPQARRVKSSRNSRNVLLFESAASKSKCSPPYGWRQAAVNSVMSRIGPEVG
jgi:hypothetical protein